MAGKVLIVEDELAQRVALEKFFGKRGFQVDAVETAEDALELIPAASYELVLTDLRLPGMDGIALTTKIREIDDQVGVLLMTAYASVESAVQALRVGAHDYLLKPLILDELGQKVESLLKQRELMRENLRLRHMLSRSQSSREAVAESEAMKSVLSWAKRAAGSDSTVLVTGETGTGKEVVARSIHQLGATPDEPFLAVNIAALPESMVESELFGHERGAFTGAESRREGLLRAAGRGTVFLDEIGELPLGLQAKLLRTLESGEIRPVGSDRNIKIEARIIAATHRDLQAMVARGDFREDLYYRLTVVVLDVPPLRERPEDIPPLVHALLARHAGRNSRAAATVAPDVMRTLCAHSWRGNVRELSNILERALMLSEGGRLELEHLPEDVRKPQATDMQLAAAVERFERSHIGLVLRLTEGNRELAAKHLGISAATLYRRLEKLGMKGKRLDSEGEDWVPAPLA